jgi:hypothetical protein
MGGMGIRCRRAGGIGRDRVVSCWEAGFVGVAFWGWGARMAKSGFIEVGHPGNPQARFTPRRFCVYDVNVFDVDTALVSFFCRLMISHHHNCSFEMFTRQTQLTVPRNIISRDSVRRRGR